jgi:ribonuclease HI
MIKNRIRSQITIFSAEQEAIIEEIYIHKGKRATVISTNSLSTMWQLKVRDGQKTQRRERKQGNVKLMWIPSHSGITGNKNADEAAKNALEENINDRELYPPQDLNKWMKKTDAKNRQGGHREKTHI